MERRARLFLAGLALVASAVLVGGVAPAGAEQLAAPAGAEQLAAPAWKIPDGVKTLQVNGYPMAYLEAGAGPTVLLVHGAMCDLRCWGDTVRNLKGEFRLVAVSLRHFYPQDWDGSGSTFTLAQHASDLAAFAEKLGAPVSLVGHSYGGLVASEVARARPELVARLVLVEAGTDWLRGTPGEEQWKARRNFADTVGTRIRENGVDAGLQFAVDLLSGPGTWARYPPAVQMFHRDNAWTLAAAARDSSARANCGQFGALKMPVLLLTGENTSSRYQQIVAAQVDCLPGAKKTVVPGVGHAVMMNAPAFEGALREFLR